MARRGRCRCGNILQFRKSVVGYKTRCSRCQAVVRLRVKGASSAPPPLPGPATAPPSLPIGATVSVELVPLEGLDPTLPLFEVEADTTLVPDTPREAKPGQ